MSFPFDWYWLAADGRVFASGRSATVAEADPAYVAFLATGRAATAWPADGAGAQTAAALDAVLRPYGLSTSGPVRAAYGDDLLRVLTDAEVASLSSASARDQRTFSIQRAPFAETDATVVNLAAAIGSNAKAWFDRLFPLLAAAPASASS